MINMTELDTAEHWHLIGHESEVVICTPYRLNYASWVEFGGRVDEERRITGPREQCPWRDIAATPDPQ